jgi:hypothetical protein
MAKFLLVDKLRTCHIVALALAYFGAILVAVIVGAAGPDAALIKDTPPDNGLPDGSVGTCEPATAPACEVTWRGTQTDQSGWSQRMWMHVLLMRPLERSTPIPVALGGAFTWQQAYVLNATGVTADGAEVPLSSSVQHVRDVKCDAGSPVCNGFTFFTQPHLYYKTYKFALTLKGPYAAFAGYANVDGAVRMRVLTGTIAPEYTSFALGWTYFLVIASGLAVLTYAGLLLWGPGARDATGARQANSVEQNWALVLGALLFLFNGPGFAVEVNHPNGGSSAFAALCTVTFLAVLLLYWLLQFDLARRQGENGLRWQLDATKPLGALFWGPKIALVSLYWTLALSLTMWQQYNASYDGGYSFSESLTSMQLMGYFTTFIAVLAGAYVVYLFALLVLACRSFKRMRGGNRMVVAVTLTTIVVLLAGVFTQSVLTGRGGRSTLFLTFYGAANAYVILLMVAFAPVATPPVLNADTSGVMADGEQVAIDDVALDAAEAGAAGEGGKGGRRTGPTRRPAVGPPRAAFEPTQAVAHDAAAFAINDEEGDAEAAAGEDAGAAVVEEGAAAGLPAPAAVAAAPGTDGKAAGAAGDEYAAP